MILAHTVEETREALAWLPRPIGFVPTMGALHAGHLALIDAARSSCAGVTASSFVNPTQFGPREDFDAYPRDDRRDLELFERHGVDLVFAPPASELYPDDFATDVHVSRLTARFEGAMRPQHFGGVALIVTKLLNIVRPDVAFFGQKDAQQLAVVRRLARDLDIPVEIVGMPTVREPDGLALSSRNAYLSPAERAAAPTLYRALQAGAAAAVRPQATVADVLATAMAVLDEAASDPGGSGRHAEARCPEPPCLTLDYLAVVDADSFAEPDQLGPRSLLIIAARFGTTRLLDNIPLWHGEYPSPNATS